MNVTIIGGGWAGLAAAVKLTKHGYTVNVLEASRQLGGRARAVQFGDTHVDNGQHIMLGAYSKLLDLLGELSINEASVLKRLPLDLKFGNNGDNNFHLRTPNLPAPAHLLFGLLGAKGFSFFDRLAVIRAVISMRLAKFKLVKDIPLLDYLNKLGQTKNTIQFLWQPLCISIMNTPIETASSELFLNVIKDAFFGKKSDSDMLLPLNHLGACFPDPAMAYIEKNNGNISLGTRVESVNIKNKSVVSIKIKNNIIETDNIILATSPEQAFKFLNGHEQLAALAKKLGHIKSLPITTLYLRYPHAVTLGRDFVGLLDCNTQWVFDRGRLTGDTGMLAAVISGPGKHMQMTIEELTKTITREISGLYPEFPAPIETKLIREKMATIDSCVDINRYRIKNNTPVNGLWIAGDYTDTGYPSTLEGAVRSGLSCAQSIINERSL